MRHLLSEKYHRWLLPGVLILFLLLTLTLPMAVGITYSGRSESPGHILTYTKGKLTWDSGTGIDKNGVAVLGLFNARYPGVASGNGSNVVAPGTDGKNIVRLKNNVSGSVSYTAVLYQIKTSDDLPVEAALSGSGLKDTTTSVPLPKGVKAEQVIRSVSGTIKGSAIQDFDITWLWDFEDDRDSLDTILGNRDPADTVTVGLYIVVEDNNSYVTPDSPKTGDESNIGMYTALMGISALLLLLLLAERRRERKCEQ